MPSRPPVWSRQELILALALYFEIGAADYRSSKKVQELSRVLRELHRGQPYLTDPRFRSASSVSRKLKNIAWVDPLNTRGTAQSHGDAADEEIWDEFAEDRDRLGIEAAKILTWVNDGLKGPMPSTVPDEVEIALAVVGEQAGKQQDGQGFGLSSAARQALERHSMNRAVRYFSDLGWSTIADVSRIRCFDLLCQRGDSELRVEVKGTTSAGAHILLTRNEVTHARRMYPQVALYILADIQLRLPESSAVQADGGTEIVRDPWDLRTGQLHPIAYRYELNSGP